MILKISAYFLKYNVAFVKATAFINETNVYSNIKKSNNFKFKKLIQPYRVIFKNLAATLKVSWLYGNEIKSGRKAQKFTLGIAIFVLVYTTILSYVFDLLSCLYFLRKFHFKFLNSTILLDNYVLLHTVTCCLHILWLRRFQFKFCNSCWKIQI